MSMILRIISIVFLTGTIMLPLTAQAQGWACKGKTGCATVGSVCADGTVFAGCPPTSYKPLYTTRCDAGESWNGTNCSNTLSWAALTSGDETSCGVKADGSGYCWGSDGGLQLGNGAIAPDQMTPSALSGGGIWKTIQAGWLFACGLKSDDTAWCWGENGEGKVGDGTNTDRDSPTAVSGGVAYKMLSVGNEGMHACAIRASDDNLRCWGYNFEGGLGDNTTTNRSTPTAVNGGGTWKYIAAGAQHTCGIKTDDTLWCWGYNPFGGVGDNTSGTNRLVPTAVNGGGTWKMVTAGSEHSCGIKTDDTAWCWGYRAYGNIGDGTNGAPVLVPTAVTGGHKWKSLSAGSNSTCGIKSDDTLWCWGNNDNGQLGINSIATVNVPTTVSGGGTWRSVSVNWVAACGVKMDGRGYCWGWNNTGRVGDNTTGTDRLVPTAISGPAGAKLELPFNNGNTTGYTDVLSSYSMFDGAANTAALIAADSDSGTGGTQPHQTAVWCNNLVVHGYSDWYLPAQIELLAARFQGEQAYYDIYGSNHQSSTSGNNSYAFTTHPEAYSVYGQLKDNNNHIRCTRKD